MSKLSKSQKNNIAFVQSKPKSKFWLTLYRGLIICLILVSMVGLYTIYAWIGPYLSNKNLAPHHTLQSAFSQDVGFSTDRIYLTRQPKEKWLRTCWVIDQATNQLKIATHFIDTLQESDRLILFGALLMAAERNVHIELLVDGLISDDVCHKMLKMLHHANIRIKIYQPSNFLQPWTYPNRMQENFILSDNRLCWYVQGDTLASKQLQSEDYGCLIYNSNANTPNEQRSVLADFNNYFTALWHTAFAHDTPSNIDRSSGEEAKERFLQYQATENQWDYFQLKEKTIPVKGLTLLKNPVNQQNKEPYIWHQFSNIILKEKAPVYWISPRFAFSDDMKTDIKAWLAAKIPLTTLTEVPSDDLKGADVQFHLNQWHQINPGIQFSKQAVPNLCLVGQDILFLGHYKPTLGSTYTYVSSLLMIKSANLADHVKQDLLPQIESIEKHTLNEQFGKRQIWVFLKGLFVQFFRNVLI